MSEQASKPGVAQNGVWDDEACDDPRERTTAADAQPFYITTTLPYVNAAPHVGFAAEIICADVRARWAQQDGCDVVFNTGTDEHGAKIWEKAQEAGEGVQAYVDRFAAQFRELEDVLDVRPTHFIRTTDAHHVAAAQELWRRVDANGYIYKKTYHTKYCVGCEMEKTDSELEDGRCPLHPDRALETGEEENYFFRFSAFGERLLELYERFPDFVVPAKRFNEIKSLVERGLQDFSVSRLKEKMPWGVPVPGDDAHVMYVWFDALTNYISTLGWPRDAACFARYWGTSDALRAVQICGKDNLRQQAAMWQAMLMAADLPTSRQIFVAGFIGVNGQKMSKSLGNVIAPSEMVARYGTDGTRYLLLTKGAFGEDSDISWDKMDAVYNTDLANGLGNLVSRVVTLAGTDIIMPTDVPERVAQLRAKIAPLVTRMEMRGALAEIWRIVRDANKRMEDVKPWVLRKTDAARYEEEMARFVGDIAVLAEVLPPFLPQTATAVQDTLDTRTRTVLFARIG